MSEVPQICTKTTFKTKNCLHIAGGGHLLPMFNLELYAQGNPSFIIERPCFMRQIVCSAGLNTMKIRYQGLYVL